MDTLIDFLRTLAIYEANGFLVCTYVLWEEMAAVVVAASFLYLVWQAPPGQRAWTVAAAVVAMLAAFFTPAPAPVLLALMSAAGVAAILLDRFNPDALRWRITGALTLYALAALAHLGYQSYLAGVDAAAWAEALGGQGEAAAALAQGRAFIETLATWGLWLILPLGYLSLLLQVLLAHPPLPQRPDSLITAVRTRGHNPSDPEA
ncbi:MAG: hypothetical protein J5I90_10550 [Caldilineales bacterium]|nr:hypothetical protein [Caldilineales bacterium]